jgi:proteic killer suppression protein
LNRQQNIRSFADQGTSDIFAGKNSKKARNNLPVNLHKKARRIMSALDKVSELNGLKQYELKSLVGNRSDQFSLRINRQYRVCFAWKAGEAHFVQILDYH